MKEIVGIFSPGQKYAELHQHSSLSKDAEKMGRSPQELVEIALNSARLSTLAITDHNDITGSLIAQGYARRRNLSIEVITGSEISTTEGHIVALYIEQNVEPILSPEETVRRIHLQSGLAVAAHPMYRRIGESSLGERGVLSVAESLDPLVFWDGFEVYNAGAGEFSSGFPNEKALTFFQLHRERLGAPIGSSDSHGFLVGRAVTSYQGNLRQAIAERKTGVLILDPEEIELRLDDFLNKYGTEDLRAEIAKRRAKFEARYR